MHPKVSLRSDVGMGSESQNLLGDCMIISLISSELSSANCLNMGSVNTVLLAHGVCTLYVFWKIYADLRDLVNEKLIKVINKILVQSPWW